MRPGLCPIALRLATATRARNTKLLRRKAQLSTAPRAERIAAIAILYEIEGREDPTLRSTFVGAFPAEYEEIWDLFSLNTPAAWDLLAAEVARGNEVAASKLFAVWSSADGHLAEEIDAPFLWVALANQPEMLLRVAVGAAKNAQEPLIRGLETSLRYADRTLPIGWSPRWSPDVKAATWAEMVDRVRALPPQPSDIERAKQAVLRGLEWQAEWDGRAGEWVPRGHAANGRCGCPCPQDFGNCDNDCSNGCEAPLTTLTSCGRCGGQCDLAHASESCEGGGCRMVACEPGWAACDMIDANGCETDVASDPMNCGGCGVVCRRGKTCREGRCE